MFILSSRCFCVLFLSCSPTKQTNNTRYGKTKSGLFNLSYRNPVAAIQAFGVSLSLYNWLGVSAKEKKQKKTS